MRSKKINKLLLSEEIKRFKALTDYNYYDDRKSISENFPIVEFDDERPEDPRYSGKDIILGMAEAEGDEAQGGEDLDAIADDITTDIESNQETPAEPATDEKEPAEDVPVGDAMAPDANTEMPAEELAPSDEVELDVTELVKGSEAAKQSADAANSKIEQLMNMVNNLEGQLSVMTAISNKIEGLEKEIERRNPTPKEKLEMRSLDSYPYTVKLTDFWADKGDRYDIGTEEKKPTEYVLTQKDIDDNYIESDIEDSFDTQEYEENDF